MDGERGRDLFRQVASRSTDVDVDVLYNRRVAMQEADESYQQARADAETAEMFESWNSAAGLVHRIQRERGATCSWVATSGSTLMEPSALKTLNSHSLVLDLRKRTNACIAAGQHKITPAAADKLREVRELADLAGSIRSESSLASRPALDLARRFCLVFNKYTELIADMLSEVVFKRDTGPLSKLEWLKEQYGQQRSLMISLCHLSEECISWFPLRMIKVLPETLEKQYALHTATRSSVRDLPKYVQADIDKVLQPPRLLSYLYRWIDDDEFELQTLHQMLLEPVSDDHLDPPSPKPQRCPKRLRSERGSVKPQRVGQSRPRSQGSGAAVGGCGAGTAGGNVQALWACLTAHMDELLEVESMILDQRKGGVWRHVPMAARAARAARRWFGAMASSE